MGAETRSRAVAVIGGGYVGAVVAACLAYLGRRVVVVEVEPTKRDALARGVPSFYEPRLGDLVVDGLMAGRLRFTGEVADAMRSSAVVFLCVGTPSGGDGRSDLSAVVAAATEIGRHLRSPQVVVTKSTVPIGSGHWLWSAIEDAYDGSCPLDELLSVASCPEFLREGCAVDDFLHPERIVLGSDDGLTIEQVEGVLSPILDQSFPGGRPERRPVLVRTDLLTAEMTKYAANAFLATKVSFVNEIARICEYVGADVGDVATAIGLDSRIGPRFLDAGIGWGGSCFGKDLSELVSTARDFGYEPRLMMATMDVNHRQRELVVDKLRSRLKTLRGRRIGLLGLAFKPETDDLRDAPAVHIARRLLAAGALVTAHDPQVRDVPELPDLRLRETALAAASGADAVVLVTEWPEYLGLDLRALRCAMRGDLLIDGRNMLDPCELARLGFDHDGVGRPSPRIDSCWEEPGASRRALRPTSSV
jgi:nucleotide sugar dehydrogenase